MTRAPNSAGLNRRPRGALKSAAAMRRGAASYRHGLWAESLAVGLLRLKGYKILARRWRSPLGEVDIVARRGGILAFVEVKTRTQKELALAAISRAQQTRLIRAASHFLSAHPGYAALAVRFDAVLLTTSRLGPLPLSWPHHLPGAFEPPG